jgi:hypothetical protein
MVPLDYFTREDDFSTLVSIFSYNLSVLSYSDWRVPDEGRVDLEGQARSRWTRISAERTGKSMLLLENGWTTRAVY